MRKLTLEEVLKRMDGRNIRLVEEYKDLSIKSRFRCLGDGCNHEWVTTLNNIFQGTGCPKCAGCIKYTVDYIKEVLSPRKIQLIGDYENATVKSLFKCGIIGCGYEWGASLTKVLRGSGCPKCARVVRYTLVTIGAILSPRNIRLIGDYKNSSTKARFKCSKGSCKYEWTATLQGVLKGRGCPKCVGKIRYTTESIREALLPRHISFVGEFKGVIAISNFMCTFDGCGNEWSTTINSIIRGRGCPKCAKYGFDSSKASELYVITINDEYCGYGITNDINARLRQHASEFKKHNVTYELIKVFECTGKLAQVIERHLKQTYSVSTCEIKGFIRESTSIVNLQSVLSDIDFKIKNSSHSI